MHRSESLRRMFASAMFDKERRFLQPLPLTRLEYYRICQRTVHFDGYIEVDSAYYSAGLRWPK